MLNIVNYYEQLVVDRLWKMAESGELPEGGGLREDVACLALNRLTPCYVRNPIDKGIHVDDSQYQRMTTNVEAAIAEAVKQVLDRPRSDREAS